MSSRKKKSLTDLLNAPWGVDLRRLALVFYGITNILIALWVINQIGGIHVTQPFFNLFFFMSLSSHWRDLIFDSVFLTPTLVSFLLLWMGRGLVKAIRLLSVPALVLSGGIMIFDPQEFDLHVSHIGVSYVFFTNRTLLALSIILFVVTTVLIERWSRHETERAQGTPVNIPGYQ